MTQLQVYSNGLSLYYLTRYFIFVVVKETFIGCLLLFAFKKIQNQLKKCVDYINLLESKLREINETHDTLSRDFIVYKEENKNLINELTHTIINCNEHMRLLEEKLCQINIDKNLNDKLIENTSNECKYIKGEISNIYSHINDKPILIGYQLNAGMVPVFESPIAYNITIFCCDCFIVSQLKYLKNIKEINIMSLSDKMFIFDNIELEELRSIGGIQGWNNERLNPNRFDKENYFVVTGAMICCSNGNMGINRPGVSYKEKMYFKNGIKKLYNQLKSYNIELTMPDELKDFVFN
jgi:hypothetical protein